MKESTAYLLMLAAIPVGWEVAVHTTSIPPVLLPPPASVLHVFATEGNRLALHAWTTVGEAVLGYALANVVALGLAISFLYWPGFQALASPWTVVLKNIPFVAIAAVLIVCFGDTLTPKLIVVVLVCFHPIMTNLIKGLQEADPLLIARMQILHATRWQVFRYVRWPSAVPYYMAAHEAAFTGSIIAAIVAEFFFSRRGLGYLILESTTDYRGDRLFAACIISSALSVGSYLLLRTIDRRMNRWKL